MREGEKNVLVTRVQVKDEDTNGSPAWRAVYKLHGDSKKNFNITTNPKTNEGLLFLEKVFFLHNSLPRALRAVTVF